MAAVRQVPATCARPIVVLHQRFVEAQILVGGSNDAIRATLEREDLDELDDARIDRLRADLAPPKRFSPKSRTHRASLQYLDLLGVRELVHRTAEADEALTLLRTARAREIIEVGLVVHAPLEAIAAQLRHQRLNVTAQAIALFERWFWSVTSFDRVALRTTLEVRAIRRALRGVTDDDERKAAVRAAKADARLLAVALPRSPASWYLVLGALGHAPANVRVDKLLEQLRSHAALRAAESVLRGGPGDETRAAAFMSILRDALELHQQVVPADVALLEGLRSVRLTTDPKPIPNIHELTGGSHTMDLQGPVEGCDT